MEGKVCTKCKQWKPLEEYGKNKNSKDGRQYQCKECKKEQQKQYYEANKEKVLKTTKQYKEANKERYKEYYKQYREAKKEHYKEYNKQYHKQHYEDNKERYKEYRDSRKDITKEYNKNYNKANKERIKIKSKQWRLNNKEYLKESKKEYYENNKEYILEQAKQHRKENQEFYKEYGRQRYSSRKEQNIQNIAEMLEQIDLVFKEKNLPIYGYIYKFENIKTNRCYIGQTTTPLEHRYGANIISNWIKERKGKKTQKFKEELIEENFEFKIIAVGCCQYHLDKLEVHCIDKYDSYKNGYNNNVGKFKTNDGINKFNQILSEHNLEFVNGKLIENKNAYRSKH